MKATLKTFAAPAFVMTIFAITCLAQAPQPPSRPSPSPQVKQTVDAVSGQRVGQNDSILAGIEA